MIKASQIPPPLYLVLDLQSWSWCSCPLSYNVKTCVSLRELLLKQKPTQIFWPLNDNNRTKIEYSWLLSCEMWPQYCVEIRSVNEISRYIHNIQVFSLLKVPFSTLTHKNPEWVSTNTIGTLVCSTQVDSVLNPSGRSPNIVETFAKFCSRL